MLYEVITFRNIRKKLAEENQVTPYLRYAIGEIVLVMVGILLALRITSYNVCYTKLLRLNS